jgi:hypothetical protein
MLDVAVSLPRPKQELDRNDEKQAKGFGESLVQLNMSYHRPGLLIFQL